MKGLFSYAFVALICGIMFSSCVPYDEYGRRIYPKNNPDRSSTVTDPKQQEIDAKREEMRLKEEQRKKDLGITDGNMSGLGTTDLGNGNIVDPPKPPTVPKTHPVAAAVPGKFGFVFSPYNNKVVDVRGFSSGTLVADPQYPAEEKKHFRVP